MSKTSKNIYLALLTAVALIVSIIESMIPLPFIAPGAKLGLANIVSLTVLIVFGFKDSIEVIVLRCFLFMIICGNPTSFIYSIVSGLASVIVMKLVLKYFSKYFSLVGVSIFGALTHNTFQILVASIMINNLDIFIYLPIMSILSIFTGFFVGISSGYVSDNLLHQIKYIKQ